MADLILTEKKGYIGYVILNRPEKLNAITFELYNQLGKAIDYMETEDDVRVVVIKGAGRCFSAGFDLSDIHPADHIETRRQYERSAHWAKRKIWNLQKPTIAQVHSHCLGGAHEIALACDLCFVSEDVNMGVPEIQFGLGAAFFAMPYMINLRKCREYLLTGKSYDGKTAVEIGIANKCVPADQLEAAVLQMCKELAMVPVPSMQLQKRAINRAVEAMGFAVQSEQWLDYMCLGALWKSDEIENFNQKVEELGMKKALQWRSEYYDKLLGE